jgi:hypothetical protein
MPRFAPIAIPDAATYTVKTYNSGIPHMLPNLTADIVITLPTPKVGLNYEFWYAGAAADAQDWLIDTTSNTYFFKKLTVLTPASGTVVKLYCDGTNWYVNGHVVSASASAAAFADQA